MSDSLLESLWARVDANIGARITKISDLLSEALSANTESFTARDEAVVARDAAMEARDEAVAAAGGGAIYPTNAASVKEFGAVGDGIADDTDAINLALTTGLPVELHDGETYRITSTINHVGDTVLFCRGNATIYQAGQGFTGLNFQGELVSSSQLSAGKEVGDRVWRVTNTSGIEPGMLMEVVSSKSWYYDPRPDATDARKSELHRVQHVESGVIHTELESNDGYPTSETVTVNFYQPAKVMIENVTIEAKLVTDGSSVRRGVLLETVSDSILRNVTVRNYGLTGVSARRAYNSKILGGAMENINGAGASYAIQTSGSTLFDIVGTHFSGCYAGIDFSGSNVISLLCSVSETVVTGGGVDSAGAQFGWKEFSAMGESQRGHGTHGPSDRCKFSGNRISGVHSAFVLRGRNHIVSENQIESRSANGVIRIYDGYNFTITDNVCDRSFFGGKDTTSQSLSSPQGKLPETFVLVYDTYITDGDGPLVIRGNKVQVNRSMVRLQGTTHSSTFVLSYEGNTVTFSPKDKSLGVVLVDCTSPQSISNRARISVGDVRFSEYNTKFDLFPDSMSVGVGAEISNYSVSGSSYLEMAGGLRQTGASVSNCRIVFHGGMATVTFRIAGFTVTPTDGTIFTIRMKPYLYGGSGSSASTTTGNCGTLSASGRVEHYVHSTEGAMIQIVMRSTADNDSVATGVAVYPVGRG